MARITPSELLSQLIDAAKAIGNKSGAPFTAERFLVAFIDKLASMPDNEKNEECREAEKLLGEMVPDAAAARAGLMSYICDDKNPTFMDDLYMKKRMAEAEALTNGAPVSVPTLLVSISKVPSRAIKAYLKPCEKPEDDAEQSETDAESMLDELKRELERMLGQSESELGEESSEESEEVREAEPPADPVDEIAKLVSQTKLIRRELSEKVLGQEKAVNTFAAGYFQAVLEGLTDKTKKRPRASFLFAGPPGVGKTFLAEKAAECLKLPFKRFDMSEYAEKEAPVEFCGSDGVYKDSKVGNFTGFLAENPKCVVLFDEIEKAHLSIIHLFLQMLDAGRIRDSHTDTDLSLSDAIIIMTTNAGRKLYEDSESDDLSGISRKVVIKALEKDINPETKAPYFPAAICSRFASGNVVMFNHVGAGDLREIAERELTRQVSNFEKETGIGFEIEKSIYSALLFSEGSAADARTIRSRAESFFHDELYELFRLIDSEKVMTSLADVKRIRIMLDLSDAENEVSSLFEDSERPCALIYADRAKVGACRKLLPNFDVIEASGCAEAIARLKEHEVDLVLLDMLCDVPREIDVLNIEDVDSEARDFYRFLREQRRELPIYLLEGKKASLTEEEKTSFKRQGVRGVFGGLEDAESFARELDGVVKVLHQQSCMVKLAKSNKLLTFETAQSVSADGTQAEIRLFDLKTSVAIESEDQKNVLSALSRPNVKFDDVIGAEDAKGELKFFVDYLKNPKKYMGTGVKAPRGILLYGPPGTGKTMLAKALASEAGVNFIVAEGNQFMKKYVGEGPEKVHELFRTARKYAPSVLFVDEIDAIAKERRGGDAGSGSVEATLTAFLTEMDGFKTDSAKPVFVLAATNFEIRPGGAKSLDGALIRRFDRSVYIDLPLKEDRIRFFKMKMAGNPALALSEEQINNIAVRSTGMSLAALESVIELALRSSIREGSGKVSDAVLEEAFETFNGGAAKKWNEATLLRVARHEAGHALLCRESGEKPAYLTVVARGDHGGYMQHASNEGKAIYTKDEILANIRTSLGGRAAELVCYGKQDGISTGASSDLMSATRMATSILCHYGMDETFGLAVVDERETAGAMTHELRTAVNEILNSQMAEAVRILTEKRERLDALVQALLQKDHLNEKEIEEILNPKKTK